MRIGFISYPMLFQRTGGLQIQITETARAIRESGGQSVEFIDPIQLRLSDFDVVHVFSAINGNYRIVETARDQGVPAIVSPLLREHWSKGFSRKARFLESLVGRATSWNLHTQYREIAQCIKGATALVALGNSEMRSIADSFDVPETGIHIVPNGIPDRFFSPDPNIFIDRFGIEPGFVLSVATISSHKNQLAVARALSGTGVRLVLVGPCSVANEGYRTALLAHPHVRHVGELSYDDPALPSAYANAAAFCLPSASEVMPLSVMEALAAGTPVVMTNRHGMSDDFQCKGLDFVAPDDIDTLRRLLLARVAGFSESFECVSLARKYSWHTVGESLVEVYREALGVPGSRRPDESGPACEN